MALVFLSFINMPCGIISGGLFISTTTSREEIVRTIYISAWIQGIRRGQDGNAEDANQD